MNFSGKLRAAWRRSSSINAKMNKIVGHTLDGHDNGTYMYEPGDKALPLCPRCGYRLNFFPTNPDYALKKRFKPLTGQSVVSKETALSCTYDHQTIVSQGFKDFCLQQGYEGLNFIEFPKDPWHFHLIITNQVKFDSARNQPRFLEMCPTCGNYDGVITSGRALLELTEPLVDGFYRTDLLFGSGDRKNPLIVVGTGTKSKLKAMNFKGLIFEPAYGLD